jgi:hypothetical protein
VKFKEISSDEEEKEDEDEGEKKKVDKTKMMLQLEEDIHNQIKYAERKQEGSKFFKKILD